MFRPTRSTASAFRHLLRCLPLLAAAPVMAQTPTYTLLAEFTGTAAGKTGNAPIASLYQATDGALYGTTAGGGGGGGTAGYGTIFKITTGGTFTSLLSFTGPTGAAVGIFAYPGVVQHTDGVFYGMTSGNDVGTTAAGFGNIYSLNGSVYGAPTNLRFGGQTAAHKGQAPVGSFLAINGKFYGTTEKGGSSNQGTLFSMTPAGVVTYHIDFTGTGSVPGSNPQAQLMDGGDGYLYGTTFAGGTFGNGTVFKFNLTTNALTSLVSFTGASGAHPGKNPADALIKGSDGNLYGTTINGGSGGTTGLGTVYKIVPSTGDHTVLVDFTGVSGAAQGAYPVGRLAEHANGKLYGTTVASNGNTTGSNGFGTVYSVTKTGVVEAKLIEFTGLTGSYPGSGPWGGMIRAADGHLYGTTRAGGAGNFGTIFKLTLPTIAAPTVTTTAATAIASTGATLNGTVNPNNAETTWYFEYGLTTGYGSTTPSTSAGAGAAAQNVSATLTGLSTNTLYNYRLRANNSAGTILGANMTFTTGSGNPVLPVVTTGSATGVGDTTATLNGTVNPSGSATTYQFEYGTTASYGSVSPASAASAGSGTSAQSVNTAVSGLLSGTTYYFRLTASNGAGPASGTQGTFTTSGSPPEPTVVTGSATNITGTSARLTGTVNPRGAQARWQFEWGLTPAFGNSSPATAGTTGTGNADAAVATDITGLLPGATIFYRLTAWRDATPGTVATGTNSFFLTPSLPDVITDAAIALTTTGGTLTGSVNPRGLATTWQFEYGQGGFGSSIPLSAGNAGSGNSAALVSASLTGLAPGTTIQYRLKAISAAGTAYGTTLTFTTYQPPTPVTGTATGITAGTASLGGSVNPNGFAATYQFEYGTTASYGQTTASTSAGSGSSAVNASAALTGLLPGTVYYFRLTATSTHGSAEGSQGTFTTAPNIRSWRQQHFGTMDDTGLAANSADPDGDGVKNLLEYAFGMNPNFRDNHLQPLPSWNGSNLITSFTKPSGVNDITYTGEVSTNLRDWSNIANSGGGNAVTYSAPISPIGRNWMRVRVTLIP